MFAPTKITQIILKLGFQRELVLFGRGFGGQRPPTINAIELMLNQVLLIISAGVRQSILYFSLSIFFFIFQNE